MKLTLDEQSPVLDMEIPVILKVRDLMKLNQILTRTYDEEERLRETLSPILQELRDTLQATTDDPEWQSLAMWDAEPEALALGAEKQKKHLKRIKRALVKNRNLRLRYCLPGSGEITRSTVIPLELWETGSGWLLRAFSYQDGEEQTFRVERIVKAKQKSCGSTGPRRHKETVKQAVLLDEEMMPLADESFEDDTEQSESEEITTALQEDVEAPNEPDAPRIAAPAVVPHFESVDEIGHGGKHPHYSLPGKKPHQSGLPNRLDRLIKRAERKTE